MQIDIVEPGGPYSPQRADAMASLVENCLPGLPPALGDPQFRKEWLAKAMGLAVLVHGYDGPALVGAVAVYANDLTARRAFITFVGVDPVHRGAGIARRLVSATIDYLISQEFASVALRVRADNASARHLYRSLGFSGEADGAPDLEMVAQLTEIA